VYICSKLNKIAQDNPLRNKGHKTQNLKKGGNRTDILSIRDL